MLFPSIFRDGFFDDEFMDFPPMNQAGRDNSLMKSDVKELDDRFELYMDLPGFKKEDVKIKLKDGYLNIEASTFQETDDKDSEGKFIRRERFQGTCSRNFFVGKAIQQEDIKAKFDQGVLQIDIPKIEKKPEIEENKYIAIE